MTTIQAGAAMPVVQSSQAAPAGAAIPIAVVSDRAAMGGEKPINQRRFGAQMTERGFDRVRGTQGAWYYTGIGLRSDRDGPDDNQSMEQNNASDVSDVSDVISGVFSDPIGEAEIPGKKDHLRHLDHSTPDPSYRAIPRRPVNVNDLARRRQLVRHIELERLDDTPA